LALVVLALQRIHQVIEALTVATQCLALSLLQAVVVADLVFQLPAQMAALAAADLILAGAVQALRDKVVTAVTALT
jgi:hypothetical protein